MRWLRLNESEGFDKLAVGRRKLRLNHEIRRTRRLTGCLRRTGRNQARGAGPTVDGPAPH